MSATSGWGSNRINVFQFSAETKRVEKAEAG
jgi:hypothetical protein